MTANSTILDDQTHGDRNYQDKQRLATKGWQVVSIPKNIPSAGGADDKAYIQLTNGRHEKAVINVYQPGQSDEMHCHPGSMFAEASGNR